MNKIVYLFPYKTIAFCILLQINLQKTLHYSNRIIAMSVLYAHFDIEADGPGTASNNMISLGIVFTDSKGVEVDSFLGDMEPLPGAFVFVYHSTLLPSSLTFFQDTLKIPLQ